MRLVRVMLTSIPITFILYALGMEYAYGKVYLVYFAVTAVYLIRAYAFTREESNTDD